MLAKMVSSRGICSEACWQRIMPGIENVLRSASGLEESRLADLALDVHGLLILFIGDTEMLVSPCEGFRSALLDHSSIDRLPWKAGKKEVYAPP